MRQRYYTYQSVGISLKKVLPQKVLSGCPWKTWLVLKGCKNRDIHITIFTSKFLKARTNAVTCHISDKYSVVKTEASSTNLMRINKIKNTTRLNTTLTAHLDGKHDCPWAIRPHPWIFQSTPVTAAKVQKMPKKLKMPKSIEVKWFENLEPISYPLG